MKSVNRFSASMIFVSSSARKCWIKCFAVICSLLCSIGVQAEDSGAWLNVQANKGWDKSYGFARLEHRSYQDFGATEAMFLAVGGGLKPAPWLKTDLSYEYWDIDHDINFHKAVLTGTGTLVRDGLAVSLREKMEFALNPASSKVSFTLRSRLRAQYTFDQSNVRPYIMSEIFTGKSWVRTLHYLGAELTLDRHNMIDLFYMYHIPAGGQAVHLLGAGYYFNF